jgi:all-trans-retinol 13,14-reductase
MKKSSTGALTPEQHEEQNKRYAEGREYDYVIIGSGMSALTAGSLLAKSGKRVCMLEAHDVPGGYAHTFEMNGFKFCAQIHYIWGCGPGAKIYEFLKKIGLEKEVEFEPFALDGYDVMSMPDGKRVNLANGFDETLENIDKAYPGHRTGLEKFFGVMRQLRKEFSLFPNSIGLKNLFRTIRECKTVIKYRNATLQTLFDECSLPKEIQAVLGGFLGDLASPPDEISIFPYVGLYGGYNSGAYAPVKHFEHYINSIAKVIVDSPGCDIYFETEVTKFNVNEGKIESVETNDGKMFKAPTFLCNMDPQKAAKMIGWDKFPESNKPALSYQYTPSAMTIYLGLKDIDLKDHGFGNFNIWHLGDWDLNKLWKEQEKGNYEKFWMFLSTPLLHSDYPGQAPEGHSILEIATLADFSRFGDLREEKYVDYMKLKMQYANIILDEVEKKYIPDLKKHIVVKTIGTPTTNRDYANAPQGNVYGSLMTPGNMGIKRLKSKTPFSNLLWCNASSGYAGIYGTVHTGVKMYEELTGDVFYDPRTAPSDEELISALRKT